MLDIAERPSALGDVRRERYAHASSPRSLCIRDDRGAGWHAQGYAMAQNLGQVAPSRSSELGAELRFRDEALAASRGLTVADMNELARPTSR